MQLSSLANGITPQNSAVTTTVLKKAEEADQQIVEKMLEESTRQLKQMEEQQNVQREQNIAAQTGLGVNIDITA